MYAKVFIQIYDGTLCNKGPWQALVTFQQLLILADQEGVVDMTASAIARRTTIPLEIIEVGIQSLLQPDPESRTPDEGGRRIVPLSNGRNWGWKVVNYEKYRKLHREQDRREYHKDYWNKKRSKSSKLNPDTPPLNSTQHTQPNQPIAYAEAYAEERERERGREASPVEKPSADRPSGAPRTVDQAVAMCGASGIPKEFIEFVFNQHEGTTWTVMGNQPITNFAFYCKGRWGREESGWREKHSFPSRNGPLNGKSGAASHRRAHDPAPATNILPHNSV